MARLADAGARPWVMCASHGERAAADRAAELRAAARSLHLAGVIQLDFPDGTLRWANVTEFQAQILLAVRRLAPVAIITFGDEGLYWHPDHIGVHERAITAWRLLGAARPAFYCTTLAAGTIRGVVDVARSRGWQPPAHGLWSINPDAFGLHAAAATHIVDVAGCLDRKLQALRDHATQTAAGPTAQLSAAEARQWLGREIFTRAPGPGGDPLRDIT